MLPDLFRSIGSDRYLTVQELEQATEPHPLSEVAWGVYRTHFRCFTGATIDPLFHELAHPATRRGVLRLDPDTSVLVAGAGPSLAAHLDRVKALAGRVRLFTSPRGAEVLLSHGVVPDLVIVEHQTALDAHHTARHAADGVASVLASCPLVAADWRTPAALLRGVDSEALFVPSPLPTWGLWPATAVAMAIAGGAERVALIGVDLGTTDAPDAAQAPLSAVLALLARLSAVIALDCSTGGAPKRGWLPASLDDAAGAPQVGRCHVDAHEAPSQALRHEHARSALVQLAPVISRADAMLAVAHAGRDGKPDVSALSAAVDEMLSWRDDVRVRHLLQEGLGLALLPRLWRSGVDVSQGPALWRPLMLGVHELVCQAGALAAQLAPAHAGVVATYRTRAA